MRTREKNEINLFCHVCSNYSRSYSHRVPSKTVLFHFTDYNSLLLNNNKIEMKNKKLMNEKKKKRPDN